MFNYRLKNDDLYVGGEFRAKFKQICHPPYITENYLPIKVLAEYRKWWLVEVLPHINPTQHYGMSTPYRLTMFKWDVDKGFIDVRR